jgi:hypothetical protein
VIQFIVDHAARKADVDADVGADMNAESAAAPEVPPGEKAATAAKSKSAAPPKAGLVHELPPEVASLTVSSAFLSC